MRVVAAIAINSDRILIGIIVELIAISLDCVSMDVDGGFDSGFDGGSTWLCWAIHLSKAFDSSDERLLRLLAKRA
jgi:hypothetical protein